MDELNSRLTPANLPSDVTAGVSQIRYTIKDKRTNPARQAVELTGEQQEIIKQALTHQIKLDQNRNHTMIVKLVDNGIHLTIDHKQKFFIAQQGPVIEKPFYQKSVMASLQNFWRMITTFFQRPAVPIAKYSEREPHTAIFEDYRSLRKGLEKGLSWMTSDRTIQSHQSDPQATEIQVRQTISNARQVQKALTHRNPQIALERLADEFTQQMGSMEPGEVIVIPTGYLDNTGSLQPVMAHFKKGLNTICLELYCDHTDAGVEISPTQRWELPYGSHKDLIPSLLSPLTSGERSTFEALVQAVQNSDVNMIAIPSEGEMTPPSLTPINRIVKWFDHLTAQPGQTFTRNEKLNMLYHMTLSWADDHLRQLSRFTPLHTQLAVYQELEVQLDYTINKIARAINDGHPIDTDGIPKDLIAMHQRCRNKIYIISNELHIEQPTESELVTSLMPIMIATEGQAPTTQVADVSEAFESTFGKYFSSHALDWSLMNPIPGVTSQHLMGKIFQLDRNNNERILEELRTLLDGPNYFPLVDTLEKIARLRRQDRAPLVFFFQFMVRNFNPGRGNSLLSSDMQQALNLILPKVHEALQIPFAKVLYADDLELIPKDLEDITRSKRLALEANVRGILKQLKSSSLKNLPIELREIRLRKGSDRELLEAAFRTMNSDAINQARVTAAQLAILAQASEHTARAEVLLAERNELNRQYSRQSPYQAEILQEVREVDAAYTEESHILQSLLEDLIRKEVRS